MKLVITSPNERAHTEPLSYAICGSGGGVFSVSEDRNILKWSAQRDKLEDATSASVCSLPEKVYATCMCLQPVSGSGTRRAGAGGSDVVVIGASDGKIYTVTRRLEKTIDAHTGPVLCMKWNSDGSAFATGGEDGHVKIWSRAGMYRNTLIQSGNPVYDIAWSPDGDSILYVDGNMLTVKPRQAGSKHTQWKAHEGPIACVDWSSTNNTIVSGGEDRTVKVWDSYGRLLFNSRFRFQQYPILSIAWAPDGSMFAVGSYDTIRLCDNAGWSAAMEKPNNGGVYNIDWMRDSTGFVCGGGNGDLVFGKVVEKTSIWRHLEATTLSPFAITIHDTSIDRKETVECNSCIARASVGWNYLVVVTTAPSVVIYNSKNWSTPAMFELKDSTVSIIKQTERHFMLVAASGMSVYSYEGRVLATARAQGVQCDQLTEQTVSLSSNTIAVRDRKNEQAIFLYEALSGKALGDGQPYKHQTEISDIALDQCGPSTQRHLAILDRNRDVYLLPVRPTHGKATAIKIASMVSQMMWDDKANILATVEDRSIRFQCHPAGGFIDLSLLPLTKITPSNEVAKNVSIVAFSGNRATLRRPDGAIVIAFMDPYPAFLHGYAVAEKWEDCQRLCRFVDKKHLWASLATMSMQSKDIATATAAYAALSNATKVMYLDKIKAIPSAEGRNGELALLCHQQQQAETIFLQAGLVYRAIDMHIRLCNWEKALELATNHKTHVDTVIAFRQKSLKSFGFKETNKRFIQYAQGMEIDWEKINAKIALEFEKEEKRRQ